MPPDPETRIVHKRRNHKKSRGGCRSCKTRRVKCDEHRPICNGCTKRRIECVWDGADAADSPQEILEMVLTSAASSTLSSDRVLSVAPFDMTSLELLHHFTSTTVFTIIPELDTNKDSFTVLTPQLAFHHHYLMHAIFSLSALHIHTLRPNEGFLARAKSHCQQAIVGIRKAPPKDIPLEVSFLTNCLLASYWLASPSWEGGSPDFFDWFPVTRLFMQPLSAYWLGVLKGIIKGSPFLPLCVALTPERVSLPARIMNIHRIEHCPHDPEELHDLTAIATYQYTVEKLSYAWNLSVIPHTSKIAIFMFPASLSDKFFRFFEERRPRALIILAHYCALLVQYEGAWWYDANRSRSDIQKIVSLLDPKWHPWLEFPLTMLELQRRNELEALYGPTVVNTLPPSSNDLFLDSVSSLTHHDEEPLGLIL